ncbi:MAG: radical SAM protein [Proteobacteria bacterium]|nr:radical SAM protein [Pseudomonadota bacterium]
MGADQKMRIHSFMPRSRANGPGVRAVIWVQGCTLKCPGCFNPAMLPKEGGDLVPVEELFKRIKAPGDSIEGITVSGGEPLQQMEPLLDLLQRVRNETSLSVLVFTVTGYIWDEVVVMKGGDTLLAQIDALIAGRYDRSGRVAKGLLGSSNQTLHLISDRYSLEDLEAIPTAEVVITGNGEIMKSGIDPPVVNVA